MSSVWHFILGVVVVDVGYNLFRYLQYRRQPLLPSSALPQQPLLADLPATTPTAADLEYLCLEDQSSSISQNSDIAIFAPPNSPAINGSTGLSNNGNYMDGTSLHLPDIFCEEQFDLRYQTPLLSSSPQPLLFSDVILDSPYASQSSSPTYDREGSIGYIGDPRVVDSADSPFSIISLRSVPTPVSARSPVPDVTLQQQVSNGIYRLRKLGGF